MSDGQQSFVSCELTLTELLISTTLLRPATAAYKQRNSETQRKAVYYNAVMG